MLNLQGHDRASEATVVVRPLYGLLAALGSEIERSHAKLLKIYRITLQDRIFTHRSRIMPCNRSILDPRALGSPYHGRMESHYPAVRMLAVSLLMVVLMQCLPD